MLSPWSVGVGMDVHPLAEPGQCRVGDALVGELVEQSGAIGERDCENVIDAELALESRARLGQAGRGFT